MGSPIISSSTFPSNMASNDYYGQPPSAWDQYGGQQSHSPYPPQDQGYGAPPPQHGYDQGGYNQGPPQAQYGQQPAYDQQRDHSPYPPAGQYAPYGAPQQGQHAGPGAYADPNLPPGAAGPDGPEGERGLGKTLLGGTAGALLGHQAGHGMLGALGGAVVANMLGGDKDKKKKKHKHH